MRLGGWWRLWIVLSASYVTLVVLFFSSFWPSRETVSDGPWVDGRLQEESRALLGRPVHTLHSLQLALDHANEVGDADRAAALARKIDAARQDPAVIAPVVYTAANGRRFEFPAGTSPQAVAAFSADHEQVVDAQVAADFATTLRQFLLALVIPPALLLLAGLAFSWVRRGFRHG